MKVLVVGANGYIGSHVVRFLKNMGQEVSCVDFDDSYLPEDVPLYKENIFVDDEDIYKKLGSPDALIHLAWRNGFVHNSDSHMADLSGHFVFLKNMLKGGLKYLSVMGSMHEIGYYEGRIDENTPANPTSQYAIAKNALRLAITDLISREYPQVAFHWLRGFYIYGDDVRTNSVFGKILRAAQEGKKTFALNSGKNKYDFIHIDELAKQISLASVQKEINGIINCCSGKPVALGEMIETFVATNELDISLEYGKYPDRPYDSPVIYGDNKKITAIIDNFENK
ncbi:MAG: NAD-dependent epimerase/dehydratase family protein [Christensenellales bacterium]